MSQVEELRQHIKHSPDLPGVYLYRDASGVVIYVGKALSLRKRLSDYLPALPGGNPSRLPVKVVEMVQRAVTVEWIVTSTESEALLLEHNLIKQHRPPFNIRLRDDKSYPYIMVTMEDEYPRVMFTRQPHRRGNMYFGPFSSAAKVRETLDVLSRVFPLRECRGKSPGRRSGSPCLQYHIKRCLAPCLGEVDPAEYGAVVKQVVGFLSGRQVEVLADLDRAMRAAAEGKDYEAAAAYRDRAEALRHVLERQQIESTGLGSADIVGLAVDTWGANVQVFITRDGKLADRRSFTMVNIEGADERELLARFIGEYYAATPMVPTELIVPARIVGIDELGAFLRGLRGTKVEVRKAERGDRRRLQQLADRNAVLALAHERAREERSRERRLEGLRSLQHELGLAGPPMRIEGFDISNLGHENIVASMVVFEGGVPKKDHYRKFSIRTTDGQDDVGAMKEVLHRRFGVVVGPGLDVPADLVGALPEPGGPKTEERGAGVRSPVDEDGVWTAGDHSYDPSFEAVPDLVLVDGGMGQLGGAVDVLRKAGLEGVVPVISLAKREEEVFTPWSGEPLRLPPDDPGRLLLQRVRDEAHRFAVGFHRARRSSRSTESLLDQLPGVGEKRKKAIVKHFGSPERFLQATREELEAVPGLPGKVARDIHAYVHKTG